MDNGVAVTLFRHGVTQANLEKRYVGWSDSPITDEAKRELGEISNILPTYDLCISSDLKRCRETAAILHSHFPVIESKAFREMHFGRWEMKTYADLCYEAVYREWLDDPHQVAPPGGERFTEMQARILMGWEHLRKRIEKEKHREVLLVTHGGVIRILLTHLTREKKHFWEWRVPHQRGIRLYWNATDWKEGKRCTSLQVVPIMENESG